MEWTKETVEQAINEIYKDSYCTLVAQQLSDLAVKIQADMSAENAVLRNRVATLERALSVSDQHVADIVLANS